MPSQPLDSMWNFNPVFDLIGSDSTHDVVSPTLRPTETRSPVALPDGGVGLGNFWKLYESLGMQPDVAAPLPPLDESELSTSDDALLPSPVIEAVHAPASNIKRVDKETDNVGATTMSVPGTTKKQRRKARREAERALQDNLTTDEEQKYDESLKTLTNLPNKKKNNDTIVNTPTKPTRALSNVGAKIRPASPAPVVEHETIRAPQTPTPAQCSKLHKRARSYGLPVTPQNQPQLMPLRDNTRHGIDGISTLSLQQSVPKLVAQVHLPQVVDPINFGLVPRTVRPVTVPRNSHQESAQTCMSAIPSPRPLMPAYAMMEKATPVPLPSAYAPPVRSSITIRPQIERHFHLFEKLLVQFPNDRKWLVAPRQMVNEKTTAEGVHVFVDASNIMIGYKDMLRSNGIQHVDMSFDSLALLMERRRPVAKRCFVGSHREANPLPQVTRLIETSKAIGYECSVQEQVYIAREESSKKKFFNDVSKLGWQKAIQKRSGSGSDSETGATTAAKTPSAPKWVEQGVDELLHLKMCQSILDTEVPSTMVLATGDGAEAEMSDGFLAHVERALRKGWKVELITWKQQTNGGYKRKAFRQRWGEQFTITELDDFLEDLIDTP